MSPNKILEDLSQQYPLAFQETERIILAKQAGVVSWPDWCFMPMAGWIVVGQTLLPNANQTEQVLLAEDIAAPIAWRYTQGVYEFDTDIFEALIDGGFSGEIPTDVLLRLPEWCVYIKTPGFYDEAIGEIEGFFAMLEWDVNTAGKELRLYLDTVELEGLVPVTILLGGTLEESLEKISAQAVANARNILGTDLSQEDALNMSRIGDRAGHKLLPLVLYLCSQNPEIENRATPDWMPRNPQPKRIRGEFRLMPAKKTHYYTVGAQLGETLRKAKRTAQETQYTGRTVSPHIRKAHWHGFWTGPRKGKESANQQFALKWLPPLFVTGSKY